MQRICSCSNSTFFASSYPDKSGSHIGLDVPPPTILSHAMPIVASWGVGRLSCSLKILALIRFPMRFTLVTQSPVAFVRL